MMFRGAYDSEFYRQVRDLLHAQVDLQRSMAHASTDRLHRVRASLDAQWDALVAGEAAHRSERALSLPAAAVTSHA
jgi:anaerobic magnesium-protoporphyrin IX monomethyl ester cyclase